MRPIWTDSRGEAVMAPRHLCGPVPESFVVLPRPIRLTAAPVVVGTLPEFVLRPLSLKAQRMARCKVARYASPVPLVWNADTCNLDVDKSLVATMKRPALRTIAAPRLPAAQELQARKALRALALAGIIPWQAVAGKGVRSSRDLT